ncbi:MAG: hypothetical protein M1825_003202 [Sarcosagium campestre]|nr:MAG: hypothetical protein M1825_003202 [Sarcosagium campestre]
MAGTPSRTPPIDSPRDEPEDPSTLVRFPPEEEADLLRESNLQKEKANTLYTNLQYTEAIEQYKGSLDSCPNYLDYEAAVIWSNLAACHLKLADWKSATTAADTALQKLDSLEGITKSSDAGDISKDGSKATTTKGEESVEDVVSPAAERLASQPKSVEGHSGEDIARIRVKALLRRAQARVETGGWAGLQGAEEDYKVLLKAPGLPLSSRKLAQRQLVLLPPKIEAAKSQEMGEMMGKLKDLGNGILKPFGLSTDNFNMIKDPSSGGYSMQFNQGGK